MAKRALVVDDSDMERAFIVKLLHSMGFETIEAADGKDGIAKAKAEKPDVVFMDVVMSDVNGFEATRVIVKETPETAGIPVIMCTSKDKRTDQIWGKSQGASGYIVKPPTEQTVRDALAAVSL